MLSRLRHTDAARRALGMGLLIVALAGAVVGATALGTHGEAPTSTTQALSSGATTAGSSPSTTVPRTTVTAVAAAPPTTAPSAATSTVPTTTATTVAPASLVEAELASMDLEDKVGQLFVVEVFGTSSQDTSQAAANRAQFGVDTPAGVIEKWKVGGVVYFTPNVLEAGKTRVDPERIATFSNALQQAAAWAGIPGLLIAADQEGGRVTRIQEPATVFPAARDFGAIGDTSLTEAAAAATARELRLMGINQVFAPVADVVTAAPNQVIGDRSYGDDPAVVAAHTAAAIRGLEGEQVAATVKHWPGHGGSATDSHRQLAVVSVDRATWESVDRFPFQKAIDAGVSAVMVGHIEIAAIESSGPATLSERAIRTELRGNLGFGGVMVTDSLRMGGVRNTAADAAIAVGAIRAGADILLLPADLEVAFDAIVVEASADPGFLEMVDDAVRRILQLKADLDVLVPISQPTTGLAEQFPNADHTALKERIKDLAGSS